jgi:hypothetical protein
MTWYIHLHSGLQYLIMVCISLVTNKAKDFSLANGLFFSLLEVQKFSLVSTKSFNISAHFPMGFLAFFVLNFVVRNRDTNVSFV